MMAPNVAALYSLTGRVALVTGGAAGIGFACARHLGAAGATVIVVDLRERELGEAVRQLTAEGTRSIGWVGDISREDVVDDLVDRARKEVGVVDLLVNNAGIGSHVFPEKVELAEWQRVMDIDLTGSFLMARAVARASARRGQEGQHRQHQLDRWILGPRPRQFQLQRRQGRDQSDDAGNGRGVGGRRHPRQRHPAMPGQHAGFLPSW